MGKYVGTCLSLALSTVLFDCDLEIKKASEGKNINSVRNFNSGVKFEDEEVCGFILLRSNDHGVKL